MKTKITCISDTHGLHRKVHIQEPCDILIFAGDFMNTGYLYEEPIVKDFLEWFGNQKAQHHIMIAGNHDRMLEQYPHKFIEILDEYPYVVYLEDEWVEIGGFKIYGTPHSKHFANWAFNKSEEQLEELFSRIPEDTDILISHAPAYGVLDKLMDGRSVGEKTLKEKIKQLHKLKLHVTGHIHQSYGMVKPYRQHITVNAAQVDEGYDVVNQPITIYL